MAENIEIQEEDDDDKDDAIYANVETKMKRAMQRRPRKITFARRRYRLVGLGFGLLCGAQALLNIGLRLSLYSELTAEKNNLAKELDHVQSICNIITKQNDELQSKYNNLTKDLDHIQSICNIITKQNDELQSKYNNLTKDLDHIQSICNIITKQNDELQSKYNNLTKDLDHIQSICNIITKQNDELQSKYNNLTKDLDHIQSRYDNITEHKDHLQSKYDNLAEQNNQIQSRHDLVTARFNIVTAERDELKKRLCESYGFTFGGGLCYHISTEERTWDNSTQHCRARQSDLMIIKSNDKKDFVTRVVPTNHHVWLGLTDRETEGRFKWVDGTPLTAPMYWNPGEPNNSGDEDCVALLYGGWNDRPCSAQSYLICERVI